MENKIATWEKLSNPNSTVEISFAQGKPNNFVYDIYKKIIKKSLKKGIAKKYYEIVNYAPASGIDILKEEILKIYNDENCRNLNSQDIIITSGCQQAISITIDSLITKQDVVLLENTTYLGIQQYLIQKDIKFLSLPDKINNLPVVEIEKIIKIARPKIFYCIPDFHNPTGESIVLSKRKAIIKLSKKYNFIVLEDLTYRFLRYSGKNIDSFKKLDNNVISLGSFSKIICPGLRQGWIAANKATYNLLIAAKKNVDLFSSPLNQLTVQNILFDKADFSKKISIINSFYGKKMKQTLKYLKQYMPENFKWSKPDGGFYIWIQGPEKFNSKIFYNTLLKKHKVIIMPGYIFYSDKIRLNTFRLSISEINQNCIEEGISRISRCLKTISY